MVAAPVVLLNIDVDPAVLSREHLLDVAVMMTDISQRRFGRPPPYGYGIGARVRVGQGIHDIAPGEYVIGYYKDPDAPGALGYHNVAPNGMAMAKVFPLLDPDRRDVTATHELFELLGNVDLNTSVVGIDGKIRAREACDPVEDSDFEYVVPSGNTLRCSNWVTPAYFNPPAENALGITVPYDAMGLVERPGQILENGYQILWDPKTEQWTQTTMGARTAYREQLVGKGHSRSEKLNRDLAAKRLAFAGKHHG